MRHLTTEVKAERIASPARAFHDPLFRGKDYIVLRDGKITGCIQVPVAETALCRYRTEKCGGAGCRQIRGEHVCSVTTASAFFGIMCIDKDGVEDECHGDPAPYSGILGGGIMSESIYYGEDLIFNLDYQGPGSPTFNVGTERCSQRREPTPSP